MSEIYLHLSKRQAHPNTEAIWLSDTYQILLNSRYPYWNHVQVGIYCSFQLHIQSLNQLDIPHAGTQEKPIQRILQSMPWSNKALLDVHHPSYQADHRSYRPKRKPCYNYQQHLKIRSPSLLDLFLLQNVLRSLVNLLNSWRKACNAELHWWPKAISRSAQWTCTLIGYIEASPRTAETYRCTRLRFSCDRWRGLWCWRVVNLELVHNHGYTSIYWRCRTSLRS